MDTDFIKDWSVRLNVPEGQLKKEYDMALSEMQSYFPNQASDILAQKAKLKLKTDYQRKLLSSATPFDVVVIAYDKPRDLLVRIKETQLGVYKKAKEDADKAGDESLLKQVYDDKIVGKDPETGEIIALWPKFKKDGSPNKLAGQPMPSQEDSMIQTVYGIATPSSKKEAKGMLLELRGKACRNSIPVGQIMSISALDRTKPEDSAYNLSSNQTDFINRENEYLKEGMDKFGVAGLVEKFFKEFLASWTEVNSWIAAKTKNNSADPIPEKFKRDLLVLQESMCVYQNFNPDQKGRIKINICSASGDIDDTTILCLADKSLDQSIDFAQNSKVLTIGRPWMPPVDEDKDEASIIMMTSGMFAYPDWKIPRVETQPVQKEQVMQDKEATGSVAAEEPAKEKAVEEKVVEKPAKDSIVEEAEKDDTWN